jgi:D-sedoheptulose 7-phosphate isomerase
MVLNSLIKKYPQLAGVKENISEAAEMLIYCYSTGGKVLVCGNGGSCSDADHIVGELMKGFEKKRPVKGELAEKLAGIGGERGKYLSEKLQQGLPAISLTVHNALITAVANDIDGDLIFAQQVIGYGNPGDILIGLSTSGNSQNVTDAIIAAKAKGMKVIGMTGETGGKIKPFCDVLIPVPETRTLSVQELHLPVYHTLCLMVENHFFEK